ncbi:mitochondrial fission ELM1 family protein [Maricaulis sp.]|uniref:mitochondrial fission ELM1 family protein n=1 Tax=Maricaulis sp. TaxID=1486257 RepID=UPI00261125CC|nr:mitochondrial fission ELM1 family protein [Maricaulis sp.]
MDDTLSSPAPAIIWVVSDGRRGIENQALGLAEAVQRRTHASADKGTGAEIHKVVVRKDRYVTLPDSPPPDLWIGCGRAAIPLVRKHRQIFPDCCFVYVQDPRTQYNEFDLILAPEHDRLRKPNAISMIGSPNRITPDQLNTARQDFAAQIEALPGPRAAILIGGKSKRFEMTGEIQDYLLGRLHQLYDQGIALMITVSRRTPDAVAERLRESFKDRERVWFFDGEGENPYFAFLAAADWIFVTEESTNMLVEAAATGHPVYALPMAGEPGKFACLHAALEGHGALKPYLGQLQRWSYPPLFETDRVADIVLRRWRAMSQSGAKMETRA